MVDRADRQASIVVGGMSLYRLEESVEYPMVRLVVTIISIMAVQTWTETSRQSRLNTLDS